MSKKDESTLKTSEILVISSSSDDSTDNKPDFIDYSFIEDPVQGFSDYYDETLSSMSEGFYTMSIADQLQMIVRNTGQTAGQIGKTLHFSMIRNMTVVNE